MTTVANSLNRFRKCRELPKFLCVLLLSGIVLFGCTTQHESGSTKAIVISEEQAIAIAKQEAVENRKWSNFRVVRVRLVDADTWRILLERLPAVPGAHASVEVSAKDGEIIGWYPGA